MSFESLVTTYQIEHKCSKAAAIRAVARSHEKEHQEYVESLRQKPQEPKGREQTAQAPHREEVASPGASQQAKEIPSTVKYVTKEEAIKQIEEQAKGEISRINEEEMKRYCHSFLMGMPKNHSEGFRRDLTKGSLSYASLYQMIREEELKRDRGILD